MISVQAPRAAHHCPIKPSPPRKFEQLSRGSRSLAGGRVENASSYYGRYSCVPRKHALASERVNTTKCGSSNRTG
jgi:hypothetical protein